MTNLLLILLLLVGCEDAPTESEDNTYDMNAYFEGEWNKIDENLKVIDIESDVFNITSELLVDSINLNFEESWNFEAVESYINSHPEDSLDGDFTEVWGDHILIEHPCPNPSDSEGMTIFLINVNVNDGSMGASCIGSCFANFLRPKAIYTENLYTEDLFTLSGCFYNNNSDSSKLSWSDEFKFYKINEDTSKVLLERTLRYKEEYIEEDLNNLYEETWINWYKYICNCIVYDNINNMPPYCSQELMDENFDCENYIPIDPIDIIYPKSRQLVHEIILERTSND